MTRALRRALERSLGSDEAAGVYSSFDLVGEIAIIRIPARLMRRRAEIGEAVLLQASGATRVFCQAGDVAGEHRTRRLELIAGSGGTRTLCRENGYELEVDVERAFFSPRLSTERARIASLVRDGESVLNMFGGVGAFSVAAARAARCDVLSIDVNPDASRLCEANAARNALRGRIEAACGDAAAIIASWRGSRRFDRTLMLLPERSADFLADALAATRPLGTIHYYSHVHADTKREAPSVAASEFVDAAPRGAGVMAARIVRPVGPRYYQTVVDARAPS